ncbi:Ig-like domain-containing protein [Ochrobactrum teleogrylli]|uniref:Uncharacterized protein n=1 Tax=Ochrobactrum teleogrylli TaxID=2479765 RepID=A0ABY2XZG5_9HYPH|nr:Ig-like domain-containing protein [[Ochrobactrum] teleogrylli]TNV10825.1 hypothetical protein FIC94_19585 [[Ochrobactrum] teleogrylli]
MKKFILTQKNNTLLFKPSVADSDLVLPNNEFVELAVIYKDSRQKPLTNRKLVWRVIEGDAVLEQSTTVTDSKGQGANRIKASPDDASASTLVRIAVSPQDEPDASLELEFTVSKAAKHKGSADNFDGNDHVSATALYPEESDSSVISTLETAFITLTVPDKSQSFYDTNLTIGVAAKAQWTGNIGTAKINWDVTVASGQSAAGLVYDKSTLLSNGAGKLVFRYDTSNGFPTDDIVLTITGTFDEADPYTGSQTAVVTFNGKTQKIALTLVEPSMNVIIYMIKNNITVRLTNQFGSLMKNYDVKWGISPLDDQLIGFDDKTNDKGEATLQYKPHTWLGLDLPITIPHSDTSENYFFQTLTAYPQRIELHPPKSTDMLYDTQVGLSACVYDAEDRKISSVGLHWSYTNGVTGQESTQTPDLQNDSQTWLEYSTKNSGLPTSPVATSVTVRDDYGHTQSASLTFTGKTAQARLKITSPADETPHVVNQSTTVRVKLVHNDHNDEYPLKRFPITWGQPSNGGVLGTHKSETDTYGEATAEITGTRTGTTEIIVSAPNTDAGDVAVQLNYVEQGTLPSDITIDPIESDALLYDTPVAIKATVLDETGSGVPGITVKWVFDGNPPNISCDPSTSGSDGHVEGSFVYRTQSGYPAPWASIKLTAQTTSGVASKPMQLTFTGPAKDNALDLITPEPTETYPLGQTVQVTVDLSQNHRYPLTNYPIEWPASGPGFTIKNPSATTDVNGIAKASLVATVGGPIDFTVWAQEANISCPVHVNFGQETQTKHIKIEKVDPSTILYDTDVPIKAIVTDEDGNFLGNETVDWEFEGTPPVAHTKSSTTSSEGIAKALFSLCTEAGYPGDGVTTTVIARLRDGSTASDPVTLTFTGPSPDNSMDLISPLVDSTWTVGVPLDIVIKLSHNNEYPLKNYEITWNIFENVFDIQRLDKCTDEDGLATATIASKHPGYPGFTIYSTPAGKDVYFNLDFLEPDQSPKYIEIDDVDSSTILYDTDVPIKAVVTNTQGGGVPGVTVEWDFKGTPSVAHTWTSSTNSDGVAEANFSFSTGSGFPVDWVSTIATAYIQEGLIPSTPARLTFTGPATNNHLDLVSPTDHSKWDIDKKFDIVVKLTSDAGYPLENYEIDWGTLDASVNILGNKPTTDGSGEARLTVQGTMEKTVHFEPTALKAGNAAHCSFDLQFVQQEAQIGNIKIDDVDPLTILYDTDVPIQAMVTDHNGVGLPEISVFWDFSVDGYIIQQKTSNTNSDGVAATTFRYSTTNGLPEKPIVVSAKATATFADGSTKSDVKDGLGFAGPGNENNVALLMPGNDTTWNVGQSVHLVMKLSCKDYPLKKYPFEWNFPDSFTVGTHDTETGSNGNVQAIISGTEEGLVTLYPGSDEANAHLPVYLTFVKDSKLPSNVKISDVDPSSILYDTDVPIRAVVTNAEGHGVPDVTVEWDFEGKPSVTSPQPSTTNSDGIASAKFSLSTQFGYPEEWVSTTVTAKILNGSVLSEAVTLTFTGPATNNHLALISPADQSTHAVGEEFDIVVELTHNDEYPLENYTIDWGEWDPSLTVTGIKPITTTDSEGKASATIKGNVEKTVIFDPKAPKAGKTAERPFKLQFVKQNNQPAFITISEPDPSTILYDTDVTIRAKVQDADHNLLPSAEIYWDFVGTPAVAHKDSSFSDPNGVAEMTFSLGTGSGYPGDGVTTTVTARTEDHSVHSDSVTLTFAGPSPYNNLDLIAPTHLDGWPIEQDIPIVVKLTHNHEYPLQNYPIDWGSWDSNIYCVEKETATDENGEAKATIKGKSAGTAHFLVKANHTDAKREFDLTFAGGGEGEDYTLVLSSHYAHNPRPKPDNPYVNQEVDPHDDSQLITCTFRYMSGGKPQGGKEVIWSVSPNVDGLRYFYADRTPVPDKGNEISMHTDPEGICVLRIGCVDRFKGNVKVRMGSEKLASSLIDTFVIATFDSGEMHDDSVDFDNPIHIPERPSSIDPGFRLSMPRVSYNPAVHPDVVFWIASSEDGKNRVETIKIVSNDQALDGVIFPYTTICLDQGNTGKNTFNYMVIDNIGSNYLGHTNSPRVLGYKLENKPDPNTDRKLNKPRLPHDTTIINLSNASDGIEVTIPASSYFKEGESLYLYLYLNGFNTNNESIGRTVLIEYTIETPESDSIIYIEPEYIVGYDKGTFQADYTVSNEWSKVLDGVTLNTLNLE